MGNSRINSVRTTSSRWVALQIELRRLGGFTATGPPRSRDQTRNMTRVRTSRRTSITSPQSGRRPHVKGPKGLQVDTDRQDRRGVTRTALGEQPHQLEPVEVPDERQDDRDLHHEAERRQDDRPPLAPGGRPVHPSRLVQLRRVHLQTGENHHGCPRNALPRVHQARGNECHVTAEEEYRSRREARLQQHLVERPIGVVDEPAPHERGHERRHRPRKNDETPREASPGERLVEHEGDGRAEYEREEHRERRDREGTARPRRESHPTRGSRDSCRGRRRCRIDAIRGCGPDCCTGEC